MSSNINLELQQDNNPPPAAAYHCVTIEIPTNSYPIYPTYETQLTTPEASVARVGVLDIGKDGSQIGDQYVIGSKEAIQRKYSTLFPGVAHEILDAEGTQLRKVLQQHPSALRVVIVEDLCKHAIDILMTTLRVPSMFFENHVKREKVGLDFSYIDNEVQNCSPAANLSWCRPVQTTEYDLARAYKLGYLQGKPLSQYQDIERKSAVLEPTDPISPMQRRLHLTSTDRKTKDACNVGAWEESVSIHLCWASNTVLVLCDASPGYVAMDLPWTLFKELFTVWDVSVLDTSHWRLNRLSTAQTLWKTIQRSTLGVPTHYGVQKVVIATILRKVVSESENNLQCIIKSLNDMRTSLADEVKLLEASKSWQCVLMQHLQQLEVMKTGVEKCQKIWKNVNEHSSPQPMKAFYLTDFDIEVEGFSSKLNEDTAFRITSDGARVREEEKEPEVEKPAGPDQNQITISRLQDKIRAVENLHERTSAAISTSLSNIHTRVQAQETRSVKILTELAFIFLPLNLAAAVFSMNISELSNAVPGWIPTTIAVGVLSFLYLFRIAFASRTVRRVSTSWTASIRASASLHANETIPFTSIILWPFRAKGIQRYAYLSLYVVTHVVIFFAIWYLSHLTLPARILWTFFVIKLEGLPLLFERVESVWKVERNTSRLVYATLITLSLPNIAYPGIMFAFSRKIDVSSDTLLAWAGVSGAVFIWSFLALVTMEKGKRGDIVGRTLTGW